MNKKDENQEVKIALQDDTGALLMINKKERRLIREILAVTLKSPHSRQWIVKKLGREYLEIGKNLLRSMGGN
ncbi:MAG: hypothetical protein JRH06_03990 [Deltaproteobacteria bacterium]|nr:hypothetical protein [Deltaproteobacteria bacterium]MBW2136701.1 hypothetical protein [Deltaproteobacteria bacterium]